MSQVNSKSRPDLIVLVETTSGAAVLGWVVASCEHELTIGVTDTFHEFDGCRLTIPWDQIESVTDATEYMTRTLDHEAV